MNGTPPEPSRVLLIRPSALGDVCRSVPLARSLKTAFPNAEIDWLVNAGSEDAIAHHPSVHAAIPFPRKALGRDARSLRLHRVLGWLNSLKRRRYDLVLDAQGLGRSGGIAWWTRAPRRVGPADARELGWLGYTQKVIIGDEPRHTVDRMLKLVEAIGVAPVLDLRLTPPPLELAALDEDPDLAGRSYAVLAPTSLWEAKRWPIERFTDLAERLLADGLVSRVVFVGAPNERDQCAEAIALCDHEPRAIDRIGKTRVGGLLALISRAALVVANDSAALHMAVGCHRPLVALFGPTDVSRVGPYGRDNDVIQHLEPGDTLDHKTKENAALMRRVSVDEVFDACRVRLSRSPARTRP